MICLTLISLTKEIDNQNEKNEEIEEEKKKSFTITQNYFKNYKTFKTQTVFENIYKDFILTKIKNILNDEKLNEDETKKRNLNRSYCSFYQNTSN